MVLRSIALVHWVTGQGDTQLNIKQRLSLTQPPALPTSLMCSYPVMSNSIKRSGRGMSHYLFFCLSRASWYLREMSAWLSRCSSFHQALM